MCHVPREWEYDDAYDAVDRGCGDFLLDLRLYLTPLPGGALILVATRDIASPIEIPAWCRLTGNRLVDSMHPYYLIKKKSNRKEQ